MLTESLSASLRTDRGADARTPAMQRAVADPSRVTLAELASLAPLGRDLELWQSALNIEDGGNHFTLFKGRGMEFSETRPYQPGDDIRRIDWRVTARTGRAHTKLFREERERPVMTWVDCRANMIFATRGAFKSVRAAQFAALVAWAAHAHGDRIGGCITGISKEVALAPERGRHGVLRFLRALEQACSEPWRRDVQEFPALDAACSLEGLRRTVRPGTIVFLVSDFHDPGTQLAELLAELGPHCDLTLCCIHDPLEAQLPPPGVYPIAGSHGQHAFIDTTDATLCARHAQRFQRRIEMLQELARQHRARVIIAATPEDPLRVLRSACSQSGNKHRAR